MNKDKLIHLLKNKDQSVEKASEPNPYSQDGLHKFVDHLGFNVEQKPKLSELAKSLHPQNPVLDTKPELENQVEKNPISTVRQHLLNKSEQGYSNSDEKSDSDKQLSIRALKQLIAKYKGE